MKMLDVHKCTSSENRGLQIGCMKRVQELFSHEHQSEVLWIHSGKALIPLFGVDVPSSSQGVRLSTKLTGSEANNQVELAEVL